MPTPDQIAANIFSFPRMAERIAALLFAFAVCLFSFSARATASSSYELARPLTVNAPEGALQVPAGQPVDLLRGANASGDIMIRFVLPNGRLRMALVPAASIRPKSAITSMPPPAARATTPSAAVSPAAASPPAPSSIVSTPSTPAAQELSPTASLAPAGGTVDFGPNVLIFDPSMSDIQHRVDAVASQQKSSEFGNGRYALLFKPGNYNLNLRVGYYTQVLGLGHIPDDVTLKGGINSTDRGNVTQTFWRSVENLAVDPSTDRGNCYWAVSQGTSLRRFHAKGNLWLFSGIGGQEWASGGFLGDSHVDGKVIPGSQQQWLTRNAEWTSWEGGVWNMIFVGVPGAPTKWPPQTAVEMTPIIAEKPYLYLDKAGSYSVMVPSVASNSKGSTWFKGTTAGKPIPLTQFHLAHAGADTAATINAALAAGQHLIFTPGIYNLESSIQVTRPGTVVLGFGYPTLIPTGGTPAMQVADVDGVRIGGLLLEASPNNSPTLLQVGEPGASAAHTANPTILYDIFTRVGGPGPGSADCMVTINSRDVIGDNAWLWRADHGDGVGWEVNKNKNGIIINGDNVTYYGLAVEHTQEYQTLWNGNNGRTYFYQSELPYDVPSQNAWEHDGRKGYASYKVGDKVTSHEAWGIGIYSYFTAADVLTDNAIETPNAMGIKIHHMVDVHLGGKGGITHVINGTGPAAMGKKGGGFEASNFNEWPSR